MQRLDTRNYGAFVNAPGFAILLLGTDDAATRPYAEDFAMLWATCVKAGHDDIRFGYVDIDKTPQARTLAGAIRLPTMLALKDGKVVCGSIRRNSSIPAPTSTVVGLAQEATNIYLAA